MNRILLADDSPHAQRMGERILREEGYEVVSVTDGETALLRLSDVDPDVIIADVFLPGRSGIEMCRLVKGDPKHQHVRMVLTAGLLETFDEAEAMASGADAIIKKPFEASVVLETIKPLAHKAQSLKVPGNGAEQAPAEPEIRPEAKEPETPPVPETAPAPAPEAVEPLTAAVPQPAAPPQAAPALAVTHRLSDQERIRAAVTIALDAAFPALVEQITEQVLTVRGTEPNEN